MFNGNVVELKMEDVEKNPSINVVITGTDGAKSFLTFKISKDEMARPQGQVIAKMKDGQEKSRQISAQWTYWKNAEVAPAAPAVAPAAAPAVAPEVPAEQKQAA